MAELTSCESVPEDASVVHDAGSGLRGLSLDIPIADAEDAAKVSTKPKTKTGRRSTSKKKKKQEWVPLDFSGVHSGDLKEGIRHGLGTITYPNGDKYVGQMLEGKRHGRGTFTMKKGAKYDGHVSDPRLLPAAAAVGARRARSDPHAASPPSDTSKSSHARARARAVGERNAPRARHGGLAGRRQIRGQLCVYDASDPHSRLTDSTRARAQGNSTSTAARASCGTAPAATRGSSARGGRKATE